MIHKFCRLTRPSCCGTWQHGLLPSTDAYRKPPLSQQLDPVAVPRALASPLTRPSGTLSQRERGTLDPHFRKQPTERKKKRRRCGSPGRVALEAASGSLIAIFRY